MKVALVHDYLTQRGGAERVFELLCQFFPSADILTSLYDRERTIDLGSRIVQTSYLQNIPGAARYFRLLAPCYFPAFKSLNLQDYDLIISSTSSFAKAVKKKQKSLHICFCHNVTRFLWDTETYLKEYKDYSLYKPLIGRFFQLMRGIDLESSRNPDIYVANSTVVAQRIKRIYGRDATVINYPIDSRKFLLHENEKEDFYLVSSRLISYKRVDLIVEAFNWLGWPLLIVGDGPERKYLEPKALDNIQFLGYVSDELRASLMARARGVIVAALEDYGLVPIEANASGTPVIAYGAGGIIDTQIAGQTGILFNPQTPEALINALIEARDTPWNYLEIREHALNNFSEKVFFQKIERLLQQVIGESAAGIFTSSFDEVEGEIEPKFSAYAEPAV
jgi:glycosyltransferase involved in cell wall biosynthesis